MRYTQLCNDFLSSDGLEDRLVISLFGTKVSNVTVLSHASGVHLVGSTNAMILFKLSRLAELYGARQRKQVLKF